MSNITVTSTIRYILYKTNSPKSRIRSRSTSIRLATRRIDKRELRYFHLYSLSTSGALHDSAVGGVVKAGKPIQFTPDLEIPVRLPSFIPTTGSRLPADSDN